MEGSDFFVNFAAVIQIGKHIEILLLSNDCVIVPGLGGFVTHNVDARYDDDDYIFLPPFRTLGFNPQLQINDSLLAVSYVEAFDISYPEAIRMIEAEVEELKQILNTEGKYEIKGIGCLYRDSDGHYTFEPCEAGVLTPSLYALSSFDFNKLHNSVAEKQEDVLTVKPMLQETNITEETNEAEAAQEDVIYEDDELDEDSYIRINKTWIRNAVAAAAVLFIAIMFIVPRDSINGYYSYMSTWSSELIQKLMPKDTNSETIRITPQPTVHVAKKQEKIQQNDTCKLAPKAEVKQVEQTKETKKADYYAIVLASAISKKNAEAFTSHLKAKGYDEAAIYDNGNLTRVIYGSFASESLAYDSLRKLRDDSDFAEAWVLKIKE